MAIDAATPVRPPLLRLTLAMGGVCVLGAVIAGWLATTRDGSATLGALTLAATVPGLAASLLLLVSRPAQPAGTWAVPVLAGTMLRAMISLGVALAMITLMAIDKPVFLLTVLGVLLACLAIEVGVVLNMVHTRAGARGPATLEGARS
jgi:hypothetical protein